MKSKWSVVLVGLIGLIVGSLFSVPKQSEAGRNNYSDVLSGLDEIENRLSLVASNLERKQSTKFEEAAVEAAVDDVAEVVQKAFDEYATKQELADLRAELMAEIESRIPKPIVEAVKSATVESVPSTYKARWTYPSTIEDHMASDHGVSTAGKTKAQLLAEHDAIHDVIGPVHSTRSATVTRSRATYSSCPGGVCPTPQSVRYSGPFRFFRR